MTLLLDTHVVLWWLFGIARLSRAQATALERLDAGDEPAAISGVSLWEMAKLSQLGRLELDVPVEAAFERLDSHPLVRILPISSAIALDSTRLGGRFPRDPADQLIAATARVHGLKLVTADAAIRRSGVVAVI